MSTLVNIYSVKWANRVSNWLSFLKFISLAFIVVLGIYHIIANSELYWYTVLLEWFCFILQSDQNSLMFDAIVIR